MLYGASGGLLALGIAFMILPDTRPVGVFWLVAAVALAAWEWRKRNRKDGPAGSDESPASGSANPGR